MGVLSQRTTWLGETHSVRFELFRHFFVRFFDNEFVTTPGQWRIVAGGAVGILFSLAIVYTQAYYHKYLVLNALEDPAPYARASLADFLFIILLAMTLVGILTMLQWGSLFPSLRDYLALAALPIRMRDLFLARFAALFCFALLFTVSVTILPSGVLPAVMAGKFGEAVSIHVPALFISATAAGLFVFFALVSMQGIMLLLIPPKWFSRVSSVVQGSLLTALICALPLTFSVPALEKFMIAWPNWAIAAPPLWFLGLHQAVAHSSDPLALILMRAGFAGLAAAAAFAILTYYWTYSRHRIRVLESQSVPPAGLAWPTSWTRYVIRDCRELGVFAFITKTLVRSPHHRLVLTAFLAAALAIVAEGLLGVAWGQQRWDRLLESPAMQRVIVSIPLALSLFTCAGLRYLFRLPAELRANWMFRVIAPGNQTAFLRGVEKIYFYWGAVSVGVATAPILVVLLGVAQGLVCSLSCFTFSLILIELILFHLDRVPFTSSYLPGRRPLIETTLRYWIAAVLYIAIPGSIVFSSLQSTAWSVGLNLGLILLWQGIRYLRQNGRVTTHLEFEELPEVAVQVLAIDRD